MTKKKNTKAENTQKKSLKTSDSKKQKTENVEIEPKKTDESAQKEKVVKIKSKTKKTDEKPKRNGTPAKKKGEKKMESGQQNKLRELNDPERTEHMETPEIPKIVMKKTVKNEGTYTIMRQWKKITEKNYEEKDMKPLIIPQWSDGKEMKVKWNEKIAINSTTQDVQFGNKMIPLKHSEEERFEDVLNLDYEDITEKEILGDENPISKDFLKGDNKNQNGLWAGSGIRKIELKLPGYLNSDKRKGKAKIQFRWSHFKGRPIKEKELNKFNDKVKIHGVEEDIVTHKGSEEGYILNIDTDLIYNKFLKSKDSDAYKGRFTGEIRFQFLGAKFDEFVTLPIEIFFKVPKSEESFVSIDFGTSSTCVAVEDGNKAKTLAININENDFESPTALMMFDWGEICKIWLQNKQMPHFLVGDPGRAEDENHFCYGNNVKNVYTDLDTKLTHLFSIIKDLKSTPYLLKMNEIESPYFNSFRSKNSEFPDINIVTDPDKQNTDNFDPIAFYAYIIGRAVNRVVYDRCYSNYRFTMPVDYYSSDNKDLQGKILKSWEFGLKKALPLSIRDKITVNCDRTEPVAFLSSVLNKSESSDKEGIDSNALEKGALFGVFDFGGGTLDTACGIWRNLSKKERKEKNEDGKPKYGKSKTNEPIAKLFCLKKS